jgi:hypothetical protein
MLQPSAEPCNLRGRAARTILGLAGSLESYGVVFMLITRKHGIPLYRAFWITGCWLGGFPVRNVSVDIRGPRGYRASRGHRHPGADQI